MPTPPVNNCIDCKYCVKPNGYYVCRRYPPTPVHVGEVPEKDYKHLYPVVDPEGPACGEFAVDLPIP